MPIVQPNFSTPSSDKRMHNRPKYVATSTHHYSNSTDLFFFSEQEQHAIESWLPQGDETPPLRTNARGLVMAMAYWEQQATKVR